MKRSDALQALAQWLVSIETADGVGLRPLRAAIDGIDASGKTSLADELAPLIRALSRPVIRASLDGFHRPRAERYHRGPDSPEGYYEDAFDYPALLAALLLPLGPSGDLCYRPSVFDFRRDTPIACQPLQAEPQSVLLFDGVFLLRPELNLHWDARIFVKIDFETSVQRARQRDLDLFGSAEVAEARYRCRYIPGQQLYLQSVHPEEIADVVFVNDDPEQPRLLWNAYNR